MWIYLDADGQNFKLRIDDDDHLITRAVCLEPDDARSISPTGNVQDFHPLIHELQGDVLAQADHNNMDAPSKKGLKEKWRTRRCISGEFKRFSAGACPRTP